MVGILPRLSIRRRGGGRSVRCDGPPLGIFPRSGSISHRARWRSESAQVGVSISPRKLGFVGRSGRYTLNPERLSFPPTDSDLLSLQIGALVLDIPVSTPKDCTPGFETVAITFGLTGAGSDSTQIPSASSPYVVGLFGTTWSRFPQSPALARR